MENEPVERSSLHHIHFRERMKWLRENNEHIHEVMETCAGLNFDYRKALRDLSENQIAIKKSHQRKL